MDVIRNLLDLCEYFSADEPRLLNRQIYKNTFCGASISIHIGKCETIVHTYQFTFHPGKGERTHPVLVSVRKNGRFCKNKDIHVDVLHLFGLRYIDNEFITSIILGFNNFIKACQEFMAKEEQYKKKNDFIEITGVKMVGANVMVSVKHSHAHDNSKWLHCGESWKITKKTNLIGFTIQSIVEGSDVTVNSEEFVLPIETSKVSEWMKEMEDQTSFYWNRDNLSHWELTGPDGKEYFFDSGWGEPKWHFNNDQVPENVRKRVISWIKTKYENGVRTIEYEKMYKFGCNGWKVCEFIDDSTY